MVLATIPVFIALLEIIFLRTQKLTVRLGLGARRGHLWRGGIDEPFIFSGRGSHRSRGRDGSAGGLGHLVGGDDPHSPASSSGVEADERGRADAYRRSELFVLAAVSGEFAGFRRAGGSRNAWFALIYLIIAGSIVGFTAYVWLLHYESPTKVGTYAYVNPVVAVCLGYFFGGEAVGAAHAFGDLLVLVSVITITTTKKAARGPNVEPAT